MKGLVNKIFKAVVPLQIANKKGFIANPAYKKVLAIVARHSRSNAHRVDTKELSRDAVEGSWERPENTPPAPPTHIPNPEYHAWETEYRHVWVEKVVRTAAMLRVEIVKL